MAQLPVKRYLSIFLALTVLLLSFTALDAQTPSPKIRITKLDVAKFPDVQIYVQGENLARELETVPLSVSEDGKSQTVVDSRLQDIGTQTVLLLDASQDITLNGATGIPRTQEVSAAIRRVVERGVLSPQSDWLAAYAPAADEKITAIKDWTWDHGDLYNALYQYAPPAGIGETPLFELLYFGLNAFDNPQLNPAAQRQIVLFSDGVDNVSGVKIDDAIAQAREHNVRVHTVLLGAGTATSRANLERIAIMTGGTYTPLASPEALDTMWDDIAASRAQRVLSYRSTNAQPKEVTVTAQVADGDIQATSEFPAMAAPAPVQIQIVQPAAEQEIIRSGAAYTSPVESLTPAVLPVQVKFTWPEGERTLRRVEYTLGSDTRVVEKPPFDRIDFPIAALSEGVYGLRVQATDELGITAQSEPLSLRIKTSLPPAPPPVEPVCTGLTCPDTMRWLTLAALGLAMAALLMAVLVFLRRPQIREMASHAVSDTIKAVTQPFVLDRRMKAAQPAKARLVLVEGDPSLPQTIEINGSNTRIGRDAGLSNVVLEDPRVSRYHCRIAEEANGSFRLFDEGSTSGTYVNYKPVDIRGQILQHGDQIHIGPIGLRFEVVQDTADEPVKVNTEPYRPQFNNAPADDDPFRPEPYKLQTPRRKE